MGSRLNAENWTSIRTPSAAAVLAIVAAVIMVPAYWTGVAVTDSGPYNEAWIHGMAVEMRKGWIYPRWLSSGFEGLGSPSFYFYPPLPFLFMGALKAAAGDWLSINSIVQIHGFLLLLASGLAMWVWARGFMDRGSALLAGIVYMIMPYHLFNHLMRGAIGEFASYAILPFLLMAMERIARGASFGIPLFAVLYAMLILTHLPVTLLASVFVIPVYAVWLNGARSAALARYASLALAGLLGIGLAAAYLVPALSLQEHINAQYWWTNHSDIRRWMIWNIMTGQTVFLVVYALYAVFGLALILFWSQMPAGDPERRRNGFLILWAWALMIAITGIVPQIWTGVLAKVQFPWRLLVAVDLLMAVLIVLLSRYSRVGRRVILLNFAFNAVVFFVLCLSILRPGEEYKPFEPPEYRAAGYTLEAAHPTGPEISPQDAGSVATRWDGEEMVITVSASGPARVTVPLNYFPAWVVMDAGGRQVPARAETPARLLSFDVPRGEVQFVARRIMLPEERLGWWVSSIAALLVVAGTLFRRRTGLSPR